jgi:hypothetical protein
MSSDTADVSELLIKYILGTRKLNAGARNLSARPVGCGPAGSNDGVVIGTPKSIETINTPAKLQRNLYTLARAQARRTILTKSQPPQLPSAQWSQRAVADLQQGLSCLQMPCPQRVQVAITIGTSTRLSLARHLKGPAP